MQSCCKPLDDTRCEQVRLTTELKQGFGIEQPTGPEHDGPNNDVLTSFAKAWIENADANVNAALICAVAGMSVKEGEMAYTDFSDFAKHYAQFDAKTRVHGIG